MPRERHIDRPIEKHVNIPRSICEQVDKTLIDPFSGKVGHGAWSALIITLLRKYIDEQPKTVDRLEIPPDEEGA